VVSLSLETKFLLQTKQEEKISWTRINLGQNAVSYKQYKSN
jgi:hypothetical protein